LPAAIIVLEPFIVSVTAVTLVRDVRERQFAPGLLVRPVWFTGG
jgi:hypothetical protein